jgi:hypothetical protein
MSDLIDILDEDGDVDPYVVKTLEKYLKKFKVTDRKMLPEEKTAKGWMPTCFWSTNPLDYGTTAEMLTSDNEWVRYEHQGVIFHGIIIARANGLVVIAGLDDCLGWVHETHCHKMYVNDLVFVSIN